MIHPAALHRLLQPHADPFGVIDSEPVLRRIRDTRLDDLAPAQGVRAYAAAACGTVFVLPDEAWSRRVRGAWGNQLAHVSPEQAHAILAPNGQGGMWSVCAHRSPACTVRTTCAGPSPRAAAGPPPRGSIICRSKGCPTSSGPSSTPSDWSGMIMRPARAHREWRARRAPTGVPCSPRWLDAQHSRCSRPDRCRGCAACRGRPGRTVHG